ncbi:MAG TPA: NIPSNAP family protein [Steroidobacteraceae bacterium]|nr:NIPSNAP family protein [Steroidobacteraceae bacterium]
MTLARGCRSGFSLTLLLTLLLLPLASFADVVHQLRIYEIFDNNKQAFHDRFRDHAMRIMAKYDFNIVAMWEAKNGSRTEFVYLLEWPDEATMKDRWAKFMADQEWSAIKKETAAKHGNLVGEIQDRTLILTAYSPHRQLATQH